MTRDDALALLRVVTSSVVPTSDVESISPAETIPEALEMDSVDFLNFVAGINEKTGLDIPERDYPQLLTVEGCIGYLMARA